MVVVSVRKDYKPDIVIMEPYLDLAAVLLCAGVNKYISTPAADDIAVPEAAGYHIYSVIIHAGQSFHFV